MTTYTGMKSPDGKYTWDGEKWLLTGADWQQPKPPKKSPSKWLIVAGTVLGLALIGGVLQGLGLLNDNTTTTQPPAAVVTTPAPVPTTPEPVAPTPTPTHKVVQHSTGWHLLDYTWHQHGYTWKTNMCDSYKVLGPQTAFQAFTSGSGGDTMGITVSEFQEFFSEHCWALG